MRPGVLLYNPISNEGHLDSWHLLFIETFLIAGWNVVPVSTDPLGMRSKLEGKGLWDHPQLIWPKYSEKARSGLLSKVVDLCRRIHKKVNYLFESTEQRTQRNLAARFLDLQTFKDCVDNVLANHESDVSLVFNMYVDGYLAQSPHWKQTIFYENCLRLVSKKFCGQVYVSRPSNCNKMIKRFLLTTHYLNFVECVF